MTRPRRLLLSATLVAATSIAWLDPHQPVRDANKLYADGKYDDAAAAYNAALVDHPDSADLHFNLGDATYKQGKYEDAVAAFQKVETSGDPKRASRVAYNVGNASYRQGQALEQTDPQKALGLYAEALASYRRGLGLAPDDEDVKFNHELVTKHIDDLKKRLEEQKKEQEQQKQDQQKQDGENQDQQQQQDQQKQDQQQQQGDEQKDQAQDQQQQDQKQDEQGQQDQQQEKKDGEQQQAGGEQQDEQQDEKQQPQDEQKQDQGQGGEQHDAEQQAGEQNGEPQGDAVAGEKKDGELSKGEAAAILDSQRGEEVSPEDVIKKLQGARVAEPAQDW